jgi:glutaredoxin-related protein
MAKRPLLDTNRIAPSVSEKMSSSYADTLDEVRRAVEKDPVVVVGMAQNPHVKNVRKALTEAGVEFTYLEYGSYFGEWKRRLAIKMWSGWPTFPQVFVRGTLIGGEDLTKVALADGTLKSTLRDGSAEPATA